jgi:hypothetical protein
VTEDAQPRWSASLRPPAVVAVALLIASVGGYAAWKAFGSSGNQLAGKEGYFLRLPEAVAAARDESGNPGAAVRVETNLPDGTRILIEEEHLGGTIQGPSGTRCCPSVSEGMLIAHVYSPDCGVPEGGTVSTGFRVTLTVAPSAAGLFSCPSISCGSEQHQPKEILEILGSRFQDVHGEQVTTVQGVKALVATGTYEWPPRTCAGFFDSPERLPEDCKPGTPPIVWERADLVPGDVIGALTNSQICMLWNYGTEEFREAHPWPEFKTAVTAWIEELGPLVSPEGPYQGETYLSARVTEESAETFLLLGKELPERLVAEYLYRGRPVAEAEFVHIANPNPNVLPEWQVARFDILQGG